MIVKREQLLNGLEYVSPGLSVKGLIDQMNCFVFKDKYIWAYNDEVATRTRSPIDIEGAIKADKLKEILHKVKDVKLGVKAKNGRLHFTGKNKSFYINMENEITLPVEELDYPKKSGWMELPADFSEAIHYIQGCASRDDSTKTNLNCIHLHPKYVEAFDNEQLARFEMKLPLKHEVLVKQVALRHIASMSMVEFAVTDNWVHFRDSARQVFSCRVYLEDYMDLGAIIKEANGKPIKLPKGLIDAALEAETFSINEENANANYIDLVLKKNKVEIASSDAFGGYEATKKLKYKGHEFAFSILPKVLASLVKEHPKCEVSEKFFKAKSGRYTFISSLNTPKKKQKKKEKK